MIPKFVKVGGYTVKVEYVPNMMTDKDNCGCYNSRTKTITIDPDMCPELQYGVLCHKLVEAMTDIYNIEALRADHHAINLLGEAIHQIMRENMESVLPI